MLRGTINVCHIKWRNAHFWLALSWNSTSVTNDYSSTFLFRMDYWLPKEKAIESQVAFPCRANFHQISRIYLQMKMQRNAHFHPVFSCKCCLNDCRRTRLQQADVMEKSSSQPSVNMMEIIVNSFEKTYSLCLFLLNFSCMK